MVWRGSGIVGELSDDGRTMRLTAPLWIPLYAGHRLHALWPAGFEVPAGFVTDFASIPRVFWRVLPPVGKYSPAAVAHDYLYQAGNGKRADADMVFRDRMKALGVGWCVRNVMYWAVRAFGWCAWNRYRRQEPAK